MNSTKSVITPSAKLTNEQIEAILIEEIFNFNGLLLMPLRKLMFSKKIDSHIKDAVKYFTYTKIIFMGDFYNSREDFYFVFILIFSGMILILP